MATIIFGLIAVAALAAIAIGLRVFIPPRQPVVVEGPIEHTPMTPLQKHAWSSLLFGLVMALGFVVIASIEGPTTFLDRDRIRLPITGLFVAALVAHAISLQLVLRGADERDRAIFSRAPSLQVVAVLLTLVTWSIVLTEYYRDEGSIPIAFPNLMFWSSFIVSIIAQSGGVLLGYAGWAGAKS